jgi:competence protein ComEA
MIAAGSLILVAVTAGAGLGLMRRAPVGAASSPSSAAPTATVVAESKSIDVHVAGWVTSPGVVTVEEGSIVADAVAAAGGMRPGASAEAVNLAATLTPGQQIVVPGPDEGGAGGAASPNTSSLISLNHASPAELDELPGVGPVLAERIVAHRESKGPFQEVEDLLQVPGIGEAKLASLRDLVQP